MSKEESTPGGLLSKVVRFVKNPTVNWTELDSLQAVSYTHLTLPTTPYV